MRGRREEPAADLYRDAYHHSKPVIPKGFWFVHDPDGETGAGWLIDAREERDPDDAAKAVVEERYHNCDYPRIQDPVVERFDGKRWQVRVEAEDAVQFNARGGGLTMEEFDDAFAREEEK